MAPQTPKVDSTSPNASKTRALRYDGARLLNSETIREHINKTRIERFEKLLVRGAVLEIPMLSWRASTNALKMTTIAPGRVVHTYIMATSDWGRLEVWEAGAVLIDNNTRTACVPTPLTLKGDTLQGLGWKITLNPGWKTVPGTRPGDLKLVKAGAGANRRPAHLD